MFPLLYLDLFWTAPEFLRDLANSRKGTFKGDVYGFSIILQEVVVRGPPYCMLGLPPEGVYSSQNTQTMSYLLISKEKMEISDFGLAATKSCLSTSNSVNRVSVQR